MHIKLSSALVVCCKYLLTCVQRLRDSVAPDQYAPTGAVSYWSTLFVEETLKAFQQTTQMSSVVIDAFRLNINLAKHFVRMIPMTSNIMHAWTATVWSRCCHKVGQILALLA